MVAKMVDEDVGCLQYRLLFSSQILGYATDLWDPLAETRDQRIKEFMCRSTDFKSIDKLCGRVCLSKKSASVFRSQWSAELDFRSPWSIVLHPEVWASSRKFDDFWEGKSCFQGAKSQKVSPPLLIEKDEANPFLRCTSQRPEHMIAHEASCWTA
jgi:hypothetical protein